MKRFFCALLCLPILAVPIAEKKNDKLVALTFDDGPSGKYTEALLDGLQERGTKATFLLCGYRIQQYPELTQRIIEEGHEIGNHGFTHKNMQTLGRREIAKEIMDTEDLLPEGCFVRFLRPPGGCCSEGVKQVAEARQLAILSWSVDPKDWATSNTDDVTRFVLSKVKDGDIILLHDMSDSSVKAALTIVDRLTQRGFRFVTVTELAKERGVSPKAGKSYTSFPKETTPPT